MSDEEVLQLVKELEAILETDASSLEPQRIETWNQRFVTACASAEKGHEWPDLVRRAHEVASRAENLAAVLSVRRDELKREMETQATGQRALKAYKPPQS